MPSTRAATHLFGKIARMAERSMARMERAPLYMLSTLAVMVPITTAIMANIPREYGSRLVARSVGTEMARIVARPTPRPSIHTQEIRVDRNTFQKTLLALTSFGRYRV